MAAVAPTDVAANEQDQAVSPRQEALPTMEHAIQSLGSMGNTLQSLDLRADPDAQATVTDFLDFTEYLPADMTRSLTLIGKLDQKYIDASTKVHDLTKQWGQLPNLPSESRPSPVTLRADISKSLGHAMSARYYSYDEALRMAANTGRHYKRVSTIISKLQTMLENYPTAEEQKGPVVATKSSQATRSQKLSLRTGEKLRGPRVPRITVPGEVLAPYDMGYEAVGSSESSSDDEEEEEEDETPPGETPAPSGGARIRIVKKPKAPKPPKPPKVPKGPKHPLAGAVPSQPAPPLASLRPPPDDAVIGSADRPWLQLTAWELAKLRKRMKKNAQWTPSETMIARELKNLGRGPEGYKRAKQQAEEQGVPFNPVIPTPVADDDGVLHPPLGALSMDVALEVEDKQSNNRGLKLNVAKKLKKENMARLAAEEAEESARRMRETVNALFPGVTDGAEASGSSRPTGKAAKSSRKRKRDSVAEADAEKPDAATTATAAASGLGDGRPLPKRTKTETPVPLPQQTSNIDPQLAPPPTSHAHSTTPIPVPVPGPSHDPGGTDSSLGGSSSGSPPQPGHTVTTIVPVKAPGDLPVPPQSPKKSTTPILPPVRETRKSQAIKKEQQLQKDVQSAATPTAARATSPRPTTPADGGRASTGPATEASRRPGSRGAAMSQEPPMPLSDRARRASTARNTPAPESRQQGSGAGGGPGKRGKRPAPGVISRTKSGGSSAVGKRKAPPKKKARASTAAKKDKEAELEVEVDDEGNIIDPDEPRYCLCNRVSFGSMVHCDNVDNCPHEWFHFECVGLVENQPARTTKWYCPSCRVLLGLGERGEVSARGVKM